MKCLYNIAINSYRAGVALASLWNTKARLWCAGRKGLFEKMRQSIDPSQPTIWIHVASLGEFEQGRPIIERIKAERPEYKILLTFFSPSGYEIRKNYAGADYIFYLPLDTKANAKEFLDIVKPQIAVFVSFRQFSAEILSSSNLMAVCGARRWRVSRLSSCRMRTQRVCCQRLVETM